LQLFNATVAESGRCSAAVHYRRHRRYSALTTDRGSYSSEEKKNFIGGGRGPPLATPLTRVYVERQSTTQEDTDLVVVSQPADFHVTALSTNLSNVR